MNDAFYHMLYLQLLWWLSDFFFYLINMVNCIDWLFFCVEIILNSLNKSLLVLMCYPFYILIKFCWGFLCLYRWRILDCNGLVISLSVSITKLYRPHPKQFSKCSSSIFCNSFYKINIISSLNRSYRETIWAWSFVGRFLIITLFIYFLTGIGSSDFFSFFYVYFGKLCLTRNLSIKSKKSTLLAWGYSSLLLSF